MKARRRALPAPPLVLTQVLVRLPDTHSAAARLLRLGEFLERGKLLTDGGAKKLALGLRSKNGFVSLTVDDVRAWGQALVLLLWEREEGRWKELFDAYFARYDKGKPRRPTRLQRLLLKWSPQRNAGGLLQACHREPSLVHQIREALSYPEENAECSRALGAALDAWERRSVEPWTALYEADEPARLDLLDLLPHLDPPHYWDRLEWIAGKLEDPAEQNSDRLLKAARPPRLDPALRLTTGHPIAAILAERAWHHLETTQDTPEPHIVGLIWAVCSGPSAAERLDRALSASSHWREVGYGADRAQQWWRGLLSAISAEP